MTPPQAAADVESAAGQQAEDALYYRQVLHELIEMGSDLARGVHRKSQDTECGDTADLTVAFDRIARCVRRSVVLARSLAEPVAAQAGSVQRRIATRSRIIREVEDVIQRSRGDAEGESLHAELLERLDGPDFDDSLDDRPAAEIIADICRDLGLSAMPGTHPWKRRTPADVAVLRTRAAGQAVAVILPATEIDEVTPEAAAPTVALRNDGSCYPTFVPVRPSGQTGSGPPFRHGLHGT